MMDNRGPAPQTETGSIVRYGHWVVRWRYLIVPLTLVIAVLLASGARFLGFDTNYRVFFSDDNPQLMAFDKLENVYNKNDNIMIALEPTSGDVFTKEMVELVAKVTDLAWQLPYARRVDSLTNFQHSRSVEDDLYVEDLVLDPTNATAEELRRAKEIALAEPLVHNRIVTDRADITGVNVTLELSGEDPREVTEAVAAARALREEVETSHPDVRVYLSGVVMLNNAFSEGGETDMKTLVPMMFGIILLILVVMLRSFSGTIATMGVVILSTVTAMGLTGWAGIKITPPSSIAPTMIMTLAIADSVHVLISMLTAMRDGHGKHEAVVESLRINMLPVFLTSLTTAIGFLSLNFSDAPPFRDLGNIASMGVAAAFVYSILFLPALAAILPIRAPRSAGTGTWGLPRLAEFVVRNRRPLLLGSTATIVAIIAFAPRNQLNDQFVKYFDPRVAFRTDTDHIMENLTGLYSVDYSLGTKETGGISDPDYLRVVDEFTEWLKAQPGVLQVGSISHTMKKLNQNMHGDDPAEFRLPDNSELAAQYLLLYEMSLPYGLDLNSQIDVDKSSTRVSATLADLSSRELRAIAQRGEQWLRENAPEEMFSYGIGPSVMFSYISERNINSMLKGTSIALILISATLILALRSFRIGALSLIPNVVPILLGFGVWGIFVAEIGIGLSTVVTVSLGIVVDDSVHFLSKYLRARREKRLSSADAVKYAFASVGKALVVTSLVLVAGFLVMTRSTFALNSHMGWFTGMTIAFALIADFLLLPPLLMQLDKGPGALIEEGTESHVATPSGALSRS